MIKSIFRAAILALCLVPAAGAARAADTATAIFAGGCFWCMEGPFDKTPGVLSTTSGYTGGSVQNPTYYQVSAGETGHAEAVKVEYDPTKVTYEKLLDVFWHNVDPLDARGQFCDKGDQYRSEVFYTTDEQKKAAEASLATIKGKLKGTVATKIVAASTFWPAEEYHQDFYKKNPNKYEFYRLGCGRDARLEELWAAK